MIPVHREAVAVGLWHVRLSQAAAERWSRAVRDDGEYGIWRYVFATEADIKQAAGSWIRPTSDDQA